MSDPLIKRQGDLIILVDGKVSCSCCETECCMYPADGLGSVYNADNLINSIYVETPEIAGVFVKFGSKFESGGNASVEIIDGVWTVRDTSVDPEYLFPMGNCLVTAPFVEDSFPDQFKLTYEGEDYTVVRVGLCEWRYDAAADCEDMELFESRPHYFILRYNGVPTDPDLNGMFTIEGRILSLTSGDPDPLCVGAVYNWEQDAPAGSPVGTYEETGFFTSAITVSL
jgi:hypothetical protein